MCLSVDYRYDSHKLGCLYHSAAGVPLDGAHDALADADALATVWKWLIEEKAADPRAGSGSGSFQAHLQTTAYRIAAASPARPTATATAAAPSAGAGAVGGAEGGGFGAKPGATDARRGGEGSSGKSGGGMGAGVGAASRSKEAGSVAAAPSPASPGASAGVLTDFKGVGPFLAKKLQRLGIEDQEAMLTVYTTTCECDSLKLTHWFIDNVVGIQSMVASKAANGVAARFEERAEPVQAA